MFPAARIGYIENIAYSRLIARGVDECDALGAAPDIPAHFIVPQFIIRAGRGVGALSENHELLMVGVFV